MLWPDIHGYANEVTRGDGDIEMLLWFINVRTKEEVNVLLYKPEKEIETAVPPC